MGDPWKSISPEGVRAFSYGVYSVALVWLWTEGYLLFLNNLLITVGASVLLAKSIFGQHCHINLNRSSSIWIAWETANNSNVTTYDMG